MIHLIALRSSRLPPLPIGAEPNTWWRRSTIRSAPPLCSTLHWRSLARQWQRRDEQRKGCPRALKAKLHGATLALFDEDMAAVVFQTLAMRAKTLDAQVTTGTPNFSANVIGQARPIHKDVACSDTFALLPQASHEI